MKITNETYNSIFNDSNIWFENLGEYILLSFVFLGLFALFAFLTSLFNNKKRVRSGYASYLWASLITTPIWLTLFIFTEVVDTNIQHLNVWIIIDFALSSLLGLVIYSALLNGKGFLLTKNIVNSALWPLTIVFWNVIKFFIVTPFVILRNRVILPIYNWVVFPLGKISKKPSGISLLDEVEKKSIYSVKELDTEINKIQSINYVKDAIDVHSKTSQQIAEASKSMSLLSNEGIFIPSKYRNHQNIFTDEEIALLQENEVKKKKKRDKKESAATIAFKSKRLLWKNIGIATRVSISSDIFTINLIWFLTLAAFVALTTFMALGTLIPTSATLISWLLLLIIWFSMETFLNKNARLSTNEKNISKLNQRIGDFIIALELMEDRLNGFIVRNREVIEESAKTEYKEEFWQYIVKFGPSQYTKTFHVGHISAEYSAEVFEKDEKEDPILLPYTFEKVNSIYNELNKFEYKNACKNIFKDAIMSNPALAEDGARELSKKYDISFTYANEIIEKTKSSQIYLDVKEEEQKNIRETLLNDPMLVMEDADVLADKLNTKPYIIKATIEELLYENKFLKSVKQNFDKKHPDLLADPLLLRFDSTDEKFAMVAKLNRIDFDILKMLVLSLKSDREYATKQEEAIEKLRQELEAFCYMSTNNRTTFDDFEFMTKFTNALMVDLEFVRRKIVEDNGEKFFIDVPVASETERYEQLDSASKYFKNLKLRNKELRRGDNNE